MPSTARAAPLDWAMISLLAMIWGGSFTASKIALGGISPHALVAFRLSLAALLLIPLAMLLKARLPGWRRAEDRRLWPWIAGFGLLSNAAPFTLLTWAQQHVTAGFAGMSMAAMPLMVLPMVHVLIPGERMTRRRLAGFAIGFLGVALLFGPGIFSESGAPMEGWARAACLAAAMCYGAGGLIPRLSPPAPMPAFTACAVAVGALAAIPAAFVLEDPLALSPAGGEWLAALYLGAVPTAVAALILVAVIRRAGPAFVSLVNYMVPVSAALFGWALLGEALNWRFAAGLGLILFGAAFAEGALLRRR